MQCLFENGSISSVCQSSQSADLNRSNSIHRNKISKPKHQNNVNAVDDESFESINLAEVVGNFFEYVEQSSSADNNTHKIFFNMKINSQNLRFQVDTGATCSLVGLSGYQHMGEPQRMNTDKVLRTYGGNLLPLKEMTNVDVTWNGTHKNCRC